MLAKAFNQFPQSRDMDASQQDQHDGDLTSVDQIHASPLHDAAGVSGVLSPPTIPHSRLDGGAGRPEDKEQSTVVHFERLPEPVISVFAPAETR